MTSKISNIFKKSYIWIILSIFYIPIIFMTIFSFNKPTNKGVAVLTNWNGFSWKGYIDLGNTDVLYALLNTFIIGFCVALIVVFVSLITVYALYKQKRRIYYKFVNQTSNIPLINPDIISAISLSIVFGALFGTLSISNEGMIRVIISHSIVIIPYGILLMYPKSEKFNISLSEVSKDLGYGNIKTFFNTYFNYMISVIIVVFLIAFTLSFDDFILTKTVSNTSTISLKMYEGKFHGWAMALGSIFLLITLLATTIYTIFNKRKINV